MPDTLSKLRVVDPVLTQHMHGYMQAGTIAPFVAPTVPVTSRSGKIIRFTKEAFALINTQRSPGDKIQRIGVTYTNDKYSLIQDAIAGEVTVEEYEEAIDNGGNIDLKTMAASRAGEATMQSWENRVVSTITDSSLYETNNTAALTGTDRFDDPSSDPEAIMNDIKEAVRQQVGVYPNSAVISPKVFLALKNHPKFQDRIKYTGTGSINLKLLEEFFDLSRGIRIAQRMYLDDNGTDLVDFMPNQMVVFFHPDGPVSEGFMPLPGADRAKPSYAYTYARKGYPVVNKERYDDDCRTFLYDVVTEQELVLTGLGATGKVGAGYLLEDVVTLP